MNINPKNNNCGTLYVVATPIGNLEDMGARAIKILQFVQCIAAEDTRHSSTLLQHFFINTQLVALHAHNEKDYTAYLIQRLLAGDSIALISDAGTPLISDPGFLLVRAARAAGVPVAPIPGPCAAIAALSVSGLPTDRFSFEGFLPAKSHARIQQLERLKGEYRTMVFYEAPHRVLACLTDMQAVLGETRFAVFARELTKRYETIQSGTFTELIQFVANDPNQQRGEIVLVVAGQRETAIASNLADNTHLLTTLLAELPLKKAVELAADISGCRKNELYDLALKLKK